MQEIWYLERDMEKWSILSFSIELNLGFSALDLISFNVLGFM